MVAAAAGETPAARSGGLDSPTPCGPGGRYTAEVPSFALPRHPLGKVGSSCRSGRALPQKQGGLSAGGSGDCGGPGSWPVDQELQGALQRLLTVLQDDSKRDEEEFGKFDIVTVSDTPPATPPPPAADKGQPMTDAGVMAARASAAAFLETITSDGAAVAAETGQQQTQPRGSGGKASGRGGKGRSPCGNGAAATAGAIVNAESPIESGGAVVSAAASTFAAEALVKKAVDINELIRPLQIESPQVVSDFFRLLKKLGVRGVERFTRVLEDHADLIESKRQLEVRVSHLERRAQDLELLNLQYRALLHAGGHSHGQAASGSGGCSSRSVASEDLSPSAISAAAQSPKRANSEAFARGWRTPQCLSRSSSSFGGEQDSGVAAPMLLVDSMAAAVAAAAAAAATAQQQQQQQQQEQTQQPQQQQQQQPQQQTQQQQQQQPQLPADWIPAGGTREDALFQLQMLAASTGMGLPSPSSPSLLEGQMLGLSEEMPMQPYWALVLPPPMAAGSSSDNNAAAAAVCGGGSSAAAEGMAGNLPCFSNRLAYMPQLNSLPPQTEQSQLYAD